MIDKEWRDHTGVPFHEYLTPKSFLGEEDANVEWEQE
jgi:hypothetical protein